MVTAIVLSAFFAAFSAIAVAGISKSSADSTAEVNKEISEDSLAQAQEQFETENYLNSTGYQVAADRAAGINPDFQDVSSNGSGSGVDYSSFAQSLMDSNNQTNSATLEGISSAVQLITNGVSSSVNVGLASQQLKTAKSQANVAELEYRNALQEFADDYVVRNTDVMSFDNSDIFGDWVDVFDREGNVIGRELENFDSLSLQNFFNSQSYAQYLDNNGKPRYTPEEFSALGFNNDDSALLSSIARSSLGRDSVRTRIYENYNKLVSARYGYDVNKTAPFNRHEYSDVPSVVSDYSNAIFDTTMAAFSAHLEQSKDTFLTFSGRNKMKIQDLENQVTREDLSKTIQYLKTLNSNSFGEFMAENDINAAELQRSFQSVNELCLQAQLDVARSAINSTNSWARQYGFYQLSCLQNGSFAPLNIANGVTSSVADLTSLSSFFNVAKSLGKNFDSSGAFSSLYY